jgi:Zn finger protein HypA/HybF involved in hydrogenase expression
MQGIVNSILETLKQEQITEPVEAVELRVGVLEVHSVAAAEQAYQMLVQGTPLEKAVLHFSVFPPMVECPACGLAQAYEVDEHVHPADLAPGVPCPKCGALARVTGGQGIGKLEITMGEAAK